MAGQHVADPDQRRRSPLRAVVRVRPRPDLVSVRLAALFFVVALSARGGEASMASAREVPVAKDRGAGTAGAPTEISGGGTFRKVAHAGAPAGEDAWLPATVPGCVHTDLFAAGKIG